MVNKKIFPRKTRAFSYMFYVYNLKIMSNVFHYLQFLCFTFSPPVPVGEAKFQLSWSNLATLSLYIIKSLSAWDWYTFGSIIVLVCGWVQNCVPISLWYYTEAHFYNANKLSLVYCVSYVLKIPEIHKICKMETF